MSHRKSRNRVVPSVVGVMSIAAIAIWQFYAFVTFKNSEGVLDAQGGQQHLWWAAGLGLLACIAAFLCFSVFLRYDRNDEMHITSPPFRNRPS